MVRARGRRRKIGNRPGQGPGRGAGPAVRGRQRRTEGPRPGRFWAAGPPWRRRRPGRSGGFARRLPGRPGKNASGRSPRYNRPRNRPDPPFRRCPPCGTWNSCNGGRAAGPGRKCPASRPGRNRAAPGKTGPAFRPRAAPAGNRRCGRRPAARARDGEKKNKKQHLRSLQAIPQLQQVPNIFCAKLTPPTETFCFGNIILSVFIELLSTTILYFAICESQ